MKNKRPLKEITDKVFDNFEWEKVLKTMIATNWIWCSGEFEGIPNLKTIQNTVYRLITEAYELEQGTVGTGGFSVGWDGDEIYVSFTLTDYSTNARIF